MSDLAEADPYPGEVGLREGVRLVTHPHPFRAMLAISSDCDGMTLETFEQLHRFLNTHEETDFGPGLGLDVSDSMWVYARPPGPGTPMSGRALSLKAGLEPDSPDVMGELLGHYAQAGWIDTLHSFGDFSLAPDLGGVEPTADHIRAATEALLRHGIKPVVWVNHGNKHNIQNVGGGPTMLGGDPASPVYALDALRELGVRHVNASKRNTDLLHRQLEPFGKPPRLWSFSRYFTAPVDALEDRTGVLKFLTAPDGRELAYVWHPSSLHHQLNKAALEALIDANGFCVLGQHLGYLRGLDAYPVSALDSLRSLEKYQSQRLILVARTSRLLEYLRVRRCALISVARSDDTVSIDIEGIADPTDPTASLCLENARGLTFAVKEPPPAINLSIAGSLVSGEALLLERSAGGSAVVGVRWHPGDVSDATADAPRS